MRKFILAGLIAASLVPAAAQAQYTPRERAELSRDRADIRDARREYRDDRRDAQRDWGRDDWRRYRSQDRDLYRGGNWRSDYRYRQFRPGVRIDPGFYGSRYVINDPWRYHLPRAAGNQRWVRNYNDVMLVDVRRGIVIDVIRGFYW